MVLVGVLWIVAALSLIVTGLVYSVRGEVRLVSTARQSVEAQAKAGAAITLALQNFLAQNQRPVGIVRSRVSFQGDEIEVEMIPLNGWIDINSASQPLLQALFAVAGGASAAQASSLAEATIQSRTQKDSRGQPQKFEVIEDLLRVPGVDYDLFSRIASLLTADSSGSGKVSVLAAPFGVINVLSNGNEQLARRIERDRDANAVGLDTASLDPQYMDNAASQRYFVQARIPLTGGGEFLFARYVDMEGARQEGLPWRIMHSTKIIVSATR
ncbi:MAG: hypothetical protein RIS44_3042 [Pseudomonadota bacterium]|jgi:general secretion pathway protein K